MLKQMFIIVVLILIQSFPVVAATLEEMDQKLRAADNFADVQGVESMLQQSLKDSAPSADLVWRLAKTYYMLAREAGRVSRKDYYSRCVDQAARAVELNPKSVGGYFFKGLCLGKLGEVNGIWSSLGVIEPLKLNMETAVKLDPAFEEGGPHRALGKMYHELPVILGGSLDKAIEHLREAVHKGPQFAENYYFLAEAYNSKKEYAPARDALNKVLDLTKDSPFGQVHVIREEARELLKTINKYLDSGANAQGTQNP